MRTVEQVVSDLKKAEIQAAQSNKAVQVLKVELTDIYREVSLALGIVESVPEKTFEYMPF